MVLIWPGFLALLVVVPLLAILYILGLRRRRRTALRYSSLALVREALPKQPRLRRYLPPTLFLLALACLAVALARPTTFLTIPVDGKTVILALDVSESMEFNDIRPNRIDVMKAAALSFVRRVQPGTRVGIVTFSTFSQLVLAPTTDPAALEGTIRSLTTGGSTAIGSGIVTSLTGNSETDPPVTAMQSTVAPPTTPPIPVTGGSYKPQAIILLTDGVSNHGELPLDAAKQAASQGVPIFTIAYGTGLDMNGNSTAPVESIYWVDTDTLKKVAALTGGRYSAATNAGELNRIFTSLPNILFTERKVQEISVFFAAAGALLAAAAMALSLLWHPLP